MSAPLAFCETCGRLFYTLIGKFCDVPTCRGYVRHVDRRTTRELTVEDVPHEIEACWHDGEAWKLICSCAWEAWGFATEARVREIHAEHLLDPASDKPVTVLD